MKFHGRPFTVPAIAVLLIVMLNGLLFSQDTSRMSEAEYQALKAAGKLPQPNFPAPTVPIQPENKISSRVKVVTDGLVVPLDSSFSVVPFLNGSPPEYRNDDGFTDPIPLSFIFQFYGSPFTEVYVNNNGNLSFGDAFSTFTPQGFPIANFPMIAPFWGDVDTRAAGSGVVYYRSEPNRLIVTWDGVGYFGSHDDKLNTFQVILTDGTDPLVGIGNNVCFSYDDMQWTTGDASGGSGGFGGSPATVGANKGDGANFALVGRFDHEGVDYDGPGGNNDGVSYLDYDSFCANIIEGAGTISGIVFLDDNGNGIRDAGEGPLPGWTVRLDPGPQFTRSDVNGNYFFSFLTPNTYTVSELVLPNWQQTFPAAPGTHTIVIDSGQTFIDVDFGNRPLANVQDLAVSVAGGIARPGFQKFYGIAYENRGTINTDGDVIFALPPELGFIESSPGGVYNAGSHTVTWDVGLLSPGFVGWEWVKAQIPPTQPLGSALTSSATIEPLAGDVNTLDNVDSETQIVRGSFDPNDKLVTPEGIIAADDWLTYQVRFQNTGTDTAFTVVVRDMLDDDLDLTTLEVGASSHPFDFTIVNPRELVWTFNNILLPDSNVNEPESHGFLKFKVRPVVGIAPGTFLENSAAIYFDFNQPVITNTVQNQIEIPITLGEITVTPTNIAYGSLALGTSVNQTALIRNDASVGDINVSSISLTGLSSGQFSIVSGGTTPFILKPGQSRSVVVRYSPLILGAHGASLRIESDDADEGVVNVSLTGNGTGGLPDFKISLDTLRFGQVTVGGNYQQKFYIWNAPGATANLDISSMLLSGIDKSFFGYTGFTLPFTLAPGDSQEILVNFFPVTLGAKSANIQIGSNDPANNIVTLTLAGDGNINLSTSVLQNPAASKYADIVVVSDVPLQNVPVLGVYVQPDTTLLSLAIVSNTPRVYRAPYEFSGSGTYNIFTRTADTGIDTTFNRSFGVVLAKPGSAARITALDGRATLNVAADVLDTDTYLLSDYQEATDEIVYQFGPAARFSQPLSLEIAYDPQAYPNPEKIFVYQKSGSEWIALNSQVFPAKTVVRAFTEKLGEFKLGYNSNFEGSNLVPLNYALKQNYPNPFNPSTTIEYDLPEDGTVQLTVYNNLGQRVRTLYNGAQIAGAHKVIWDGRDDQGNPLASGIYFYSLKTIKLSQTKKMLLIH